jgi:hypothetical protein
MPVDDAALAAAVNQGIADAAPSAMPASAEPSGEGDDQDTGGDSGALEASSADGAGEGGEGSGEGSGPVVDAPDDADPNATAVAAPGTDGVALGQDGKPLAADGKKPEGEAKVPDPINDPLPNALKKETKERITTLASMVKETSAKLETVTSERNDILDAIVHTGATPVQYKQSLDYLRLVNSPSREDKKAALAIMQGEIRALATMIGEPVPGVNFLEGHQDLIDAVGGGRITHQHAMELAAARASINRNVQIDQKNAETQTQQRQQADAAAQGRQALTNLGNSLKSDPHYQYKCSVLAKTVPAALKRMHPSQWAAAFKEAYDNVPAPAAPAPRPAAATTGSPPAGGAVNRCVQATRQGRNARPRRHCRRRLTSAFETREGSPRPREGLWTSN